MCNQWCIDFAEQTLQYWGDAADVLEVGSRVVFGTVRSVCEDRARTYLGVDIEEGPGVDRVVDAVELTRHFGTERYDVVLTTEMVEHVPDWTRILYELLAVLKDGGLLVLTTRSVGFGVHSFPEDHWRYSPGDLQEIFAGVAEVLVTDSDHTLEYPCGVGIAVRRTASLEALAQWRTQLYSKCRLFHIQLGRRASCAELRRARLTDPAAGASSEPADQMQWRAQVRRQLAQAVRQLCPDSAAEILWIGPQGERPELPVATLFELPREEETEAWAASGRIGFAVDSYDLVVASDALERIPLPANGRCIYLDRPRFLWELARISRHGVVISSRFFSPALQVINEAFRLGAPGSDVTAWLNGAGDVTTLPRAGEVEEFLTQQGMLVAYRPLGSLEQWLAAQPPFACRGSSDLAADGGRSMAHERVGQVFHEPSPRGLMLATHGRRAHIADDEWRTAPSE